MRPTTTRLTAEQICGLIHNAARTKDVAMLRQAALDASKFLRSRLSEAAYVGECHHCDESDAGEPCRWCGLVLEREAWATTPRRRSRPSASC